MESTVDARVFPFLPNEFLQLYVYLCLLKYTRTYKFYTYFSDVKISLVV
jgi:hypothetical protein